MSIDDLIARLEAAAAGSDELNGAISDCLTGQTDSYGDYTRSIDFALTLVPKSAVWHLMTDYGDLHRAKVGPRENPSASIYNAHPEIFVEADAATPALALCIAALKSRLS